MSYLERCRLALALALALAIVLGVLGPARSALANEEDAPAPADAAPGHSRFVLRLGAAGAYRPLYDLSILGTGVALSIGGENPEVGGHANFRVVDGRTMDGLGVLEVATTGSAEWRIGAGFRFGLGGGLTYFAVRRATTGSELHSLGPTFLGRLGYDLGEHVYALVDLELQIQAGAPTGGPTLQIGVRF